MKAGQPNSRFLDAKLFNELVLTPYREAKFEPHTGPFLFEFQRHGLSSEEFCYRLDTFFSQLPKDFRYAVEIRNAGLLGSDYRQVLENHGIAHVYNHWSYMPSLAEQHQRMERFTAPFTVLRLLTPLKMTYEAAKKRAEPYTKMVEELPRWARIQGSHRGAIDITMAMTNFYLGDTMALDSLLAACAVTCQSPWSSIVSDDDGEASGNALGSARDSLTVVGVKTTLDGILRGDCIRWYPKIAMMDATRVDLHQKAL